MVKTCCESNLFYLYNKPRALFSSLVLCLVTRVVKLDSFQQFSAKVGIQVVYLEPLPNLQEVSVQGFKCLFGVNSKAHPWSIPALNEVLNVEKDNVGFGDD